MSKWKEVKLVEVADVKQGYAFKSTEFANSGTPVIKIKNVVPPRISFDEVDYYLGEVTDKLEQFIVRENDIIISMTGSNVSQMASANYFYARHYKFLKEEIIIEPGFSYVSSFTEIISPIFSQIKTLTLQNQKLCALRELY